MRQAVITVPLDYGFTAVVEWDGSFYRWVLHRPGGSVVSESSPSYSSKALAIHDALSEYLFSGKCL